MIVVEREIAEVSMDRTIRKGLAWLKSVSAHACFHSKDPNTTVGAAILRPDWSMVSMSYNGMPVGAKEGPEVWANREEKYKRVVHAEENALLFAHESVMGSTLVCNLFPCHRCARLIAQSGVRTLIFSADIRPDLEPDVALELMAGMQIIQIRGVAFPTTQIEFKGAKWDS